MQHLRLSTSRPIRPLPHSRQWTNVLPVSGPSLFGGIVPEGFAFSVTPTTADTLEGCTVGVNQGQSGKGTGGPSPRNGPGGPDAGGRQPRSILDALPPSLERVLSRAVICHQMPCFAPPAGRIPSPRRLAPGRKVWKTPGHSGRWWSAEDPSEFWAFGRRALQPADGRCLLPRRNRLEVLLFSAKGHVIEPQSQVRFCVDRRIELRPPPIVKPPL